MLDKIRQFFRKNKTLKEVFDIAKKKGELEDWQIKEVGAGIPESEYSIVDLIREKLKGISIDFTGVVRGKNSRGEMEYFDITEGMTESEKVEFINNAKALNTNTLKKIAEYLINIQGNFSIREAQNETQRHFALATINGIELLLDAVKSLAEAAETEKEEKMTNEEKYRPI